MSILKKIAHAFGWLKDKVGSGDTEADKVNKQAGFPSDTDANMWGQGENKQYEKTTTNTQSILNVAYWSLWASAVYESFNEGGVSGVLGLFGLIFNDNFFPDSDKQNGSGGGGSADSLIKMLGLGGAGILVFWFFFDDD